MLPLLSDLGALKDFWDFVRRIQEWLTLGGAALAGSIALLFLVTWTLSFVRRAQAKRKALLSTLALVAAYPAIGLTLVAAAGLFIPSLAPLILKSFALAALAAALSCCLAVASILRGGNAHDLARARRSLLLAGTPWYCLAIYLALHL